MRLDSYLVENGFFESRNRATVAIKSGLVGVDGKVATKPSLRVGNLANVHVQESKFYVSRAAKKLEEYLKEYALPIEDAKCLDIGSSTGGFTQILLENGVKSVDCVDVGKQQLHQSLREDRRVRVYEETDIRTFGKSGYSLIVSDVSFISLLKILDAIDLAATKGAVIALLFKPQFEVGRNVKRDSKGVVLDKGAIEFAKVQFLEATKSLEWKLLDSRESKITGKEGNTEYFYTFAKGQC